MPCQRCKLQRESQHATLGGCIDALKAEVESGRRAWEIEHKDSEDIEKELDVLRPLARATKALYQRVKLLSYQEIGPVQRLLIEAGYLAEEAE